MDDDSLTLMAFALTRVTVAGDGMYMYFQGAGGGPDFRVAMYAPDGRRMRDELRRQLDLMDTAEDPSATPASLN